MTTSAHNLPLFPKNEVPTGVDPCYHEGRARRSGYGRIAGVDEAGRGPLAGPVVAAAVILPQESVLEGVQDSKKMTAHARNQTYTLIESQALAVGVGVVSNQYIDAHNILKASLEAMRRAVSYLEPAADYLLVDGIHGIPIHIPQKCLKRGDQISLSISAASIIAKVYRDRIMQSYDGRYPQYGFAGHKGYPTKRHRSVLRRLGPSPIHRMTFKGVADNMQD